MDQSMHPKLNRIVVAQLNNEFTVKLLYRCGGVITLIEEKLIYPPMLINEEEDFLV